MRNNLKSDFEIISEIMKLICYLKASYNCSSHEDPALGLRITRIASVLRFPSLCLRILIVSFSVSSETPSNKGIPMRTVFFVLVFSMEDSKEELLSISNFDGRILYADIIKATNNFDAMYCIGKGGHGSVYKTKLPSASIVAVKKLHYPYPNRENIFRKEFLNEIKALTEIRHRNIVKFYGFCSNAHHSFLVYEYLEKGSLDTILSNEEKAKGLDWPKRLNIIESVAQALSYMHHDCSPPIVHRDISSKNILLDQDYQAHVSDFGTAKLLKLDSSNQTGFAST
ncbi:hypothetical protein ACOSQ2_014169 [Xanthoceras sorbifolium]